MINKLLKITVKYTYGQDDYDVSQTEITIKAALAEIMRRAATGLQKTGQVAGRKTITFTFYVNEKGEHFSFFFGSLENVTTNDIIEE